MKTKTNLIYLGSVSSATKGFSGLALEGIGPFRGKKQ